MLGCSLHEPALRFGYLSRGVVGAKRGLGKGGIVPILFTKPILYLLKHPKQPELLVIPVIYCVEPYWIDSTGQLNNVPLLLASKIIIFSTSNYVIFQFRLA
jgi:hypothetical protein